MKYKRIPVLKQTSTNSSLDGLIHLLSQLYPRFLRRLLFLVARFVVRVR